MSYNLEYYKNFQLKIGRKLRILSLGGEKQYLIEKERV